MTSKFWNAAMLVLPVTGALMTLGFIAMLSSSAALASAPLWLPNFLLACVPVGVALSWMLAPTLGAWLAGPKAVAAPAYQTTDTFYGDETGARPSAANDIAANDDHVEQSQPSTVHIRRLDRIAFTDDDYTRRLG